MKNKNDLSVCCLADLHGHLPEIPPCDLLLLGGDYVHTRKGDWVAQLKWINKEFAPWLEEISRRSIIVGVAGNHDYIFEHYKEMLPPLQWIYLEDSGATLNIKGQNWKIWGSPQNLRFFDWSFNRTEGELSKYWDLIPDDTQILLLHQPPYGVADITPYPQYNNGNTHVGSVSLRAKIEKLAKLGNLQLIVTGHLHSNYGTHGCFGVPLVSASYVNEDYKEANQPIVLSIGSPDQPIILVN